MEWTQENLNSLYLKIQQMAVTDEEFRKALLENPNKVIEELIGEKLPEGFKVNIIENDPAYNATFVLPSFMGEELEDEDLDQVAGGISVLAVISTCAVAIDVGGGCAADVCGARGRAK